ncbi:MAG: CBS domain-containing protein [Alphaproteobacteria bacterium]|nr:CBS domain-containing protein [Alphaproteobacteria bacterium]MCB9696785.1 CBS domain-containing protein [Alphaproteobacteria bacterium]
MRVSELMSAEPVVVRSDDDLATCAGHLVRMGVRHLPVVGADGELAGVLTDAALFRHGALVGGDRAWMPRETDQDLRAGGICDPAEIVVGPDVGLETVLRRLARTRQDFAVVVEGGHPVGIVTEHDTLKIALDLLPVMTLATEVGVTDVITVGLDETVGAALARMEEHHIRHLVVTDADGVVSGVVSLGDLTAEPSADTLIATLVHERPPFVTTADATLRDVARGMLERNLGCVPVVRPDRRVVAIVSRRDVMEAAVGALEDEGLFEG